MDQIAKLRERLTKALVLTSKNSGLGDPELMTIALNDVKKTFSTMSIVISGDSIDRALQEFRTSGVIESYTQLKYVCFGVGQRIKGSNWSVLSEAADFSSLMKKVDPGNLTPRQFLKCYQALLIAYFDFRSTEPALARANWIVLREFLRNKLTFFEGKERLPGWIAILRSNRNLLGEDPCAQYGAKLLSGETSEFSEVCQALCVPTDSWVYEEAVLAQIRYACSLDDDGFQTHLDSLVATCMGTGDLKLADGLTRQASAFLVKRYARVSGNTENSALRDLAISKFGNPWLKKVSWDAHVADEPARQMVDGWLKRKLITDFFSLLSEDGLADQSRLDYWLRFEPVIDDMWFALGSDAQKNTSKEFLSIRKRAEGRILRLDSAGAWNNNAFIMRMGTLLIVEFALKGNACFVFNYEKLPFSLETKSVSGDAAGLKSKMYLYRVVHVEGWQDKIDSWLRQKLGWNLDGVPGYISKKIPKAHASARNYMTQSSPSEESQTIAYLKTRGIEVDDNRLKGGSLWIRMDNTDLSLNKTVEALGFRYAANKGWWKE